MVSQFTVFFHVDIDKLASNTQQIKVQTPIYCQKSQKSIDDCHLTCEATGRGLPDMMSESEGEGGHGKADVVA